MELASIHEVAVRTYHYHGCDTFLRHHCDYDLRAHFCNCLYDKFPSHKTTGRADDDYDDGSILNERNLLY